MKSQKILWINPSFLDYRLPLYAELDKLCNNSFYILYSKERVPKRCHSKIQEINILSAYLSDILIRMVP